MENPGLKLTEDLEFIAYMNRNRNEALFLIIFDIAGITNYSLHTRKEMGYENGIPAGVYTSMSRQGVNLHVLKKEHRTLEFLSKAGF
jgi:hypothetical protein